MSRVQDFRMNAATLTYLLRLNCFCILFHVSCTAADVTRNSSCYKYSDCVDFGFIDEFTALVAGATTSVAVCIIAGFMFWKFEKKSQYEARLQRTQEELYELGSALTFLRKLKRGLKNQREELIQQLDDTERETEEINTKLQSVKNKIAESEKEKATDKKERYLRKTQNLINAKGKLEERKAYLEKEQLKTEQHLQETEQEISRITDRKTKVEKHVTDKTHLHTD